MNFDFAGRARIANNLHRHAPHERLNPTSSGVVFATIEERELDAKFSLSWVKSPNWKTQGQRQVLKRPVEIAVMTDCAKLSVGDDADLVRPAFDCCQTVMASRILAWTLGSAQSNRATSYAGQARANA